jgi:hypothetical protein
MVKPSDEHIPLGGFVLRKTMTSREASQPAHPPDVRPGFRIVCINCDALGIAFDCPEGAPPSTPIRCQHCGAPRGTLGDLRELSVSQRQDLFDV